MSALTAIAEIETGYRVQLASLLPAVQLAYFVLFWPLTYAGDIVTADLATGPLPGAEPFLLNRLFFPAMAALSVVLLVAERRRLARFRFGSLILSGGFLAYLGLTFLWALAPSVTVSKFALLGMQVVSLAVPVLLARRVDDILLPMLLAMGVTLVANLLAVGIRPSTPIGYAGIYSHKNTLGEVAALGGFFALYGVLQSHRRVRAVSLVLLAITALLLYLSQSKTSLALFAIAPAVALGAYLAHRSFRLSFAVLLVVGAIPFAFILAGGFPGFTFHDLSIAVTGDGTFTGRTELWEFAVHHIADSPWTGYGYQSFWGVDGVSPASRMPEGFLQRAPHAHNGYLDLLLQGGLVALALFVLMLLMAARWIDRLADRNPAVGFFAMSVLVFLLLANLLETIWMQGLSASSMLAMLFILFASVTRDSRALT